MLTTNIACEIILIRSNPNLGAYYLRVSHIFICLFQKKETITLKVFCFCKKRFTSEQLQGEYFHLELCKQHKTALFHFMKQNLHGNWDHPLDGIKIGTAHFCSRLGGDESGFCDRFL